VGGLGALKASPSKREEDPPDSNCVSSLIKMKAKRFMLKKNLKLDSDSGEEDLNNSMSIEM